MIKTVMGRIGEQDKSRQVRRGPSPREDDTNVIPPSCWRRSCAANMESPGVEPGRGAYMTGESCNKSWMRRLPLVVGLLAAALSVSALGQSVPFPTYQVGANQNGSQGPDYPSTFTTPWVVSNGQIITPAGTTVYLGTTTRAKAVALNPNSSTH